MAWRNQKRFSVLPGVRLNVRKGGFTTGVGTRGAWYTFGLGKSQVTVGVPATGISYAASAPAGAGGAIQGGRRRAVLYGMLVAALGLAAWKWWS
jgi:hypothetical protein